MVLKLRWRTSIISVTKIFAFRSKYNMIHLWVNRSPKLNIIDEKTRSSCMEILSSQQFGITIFPIPQI